MWIRSQLNNDEIRPLLIKVDSLELGDDKGDMNCIVANNLYNLGTYKSKERALEVLDEIQENICDFENRKSRGCLDYYNVVHQMPEEWLNEFYNNIGNFSVNYN